MRSLQREPALLLALLAVTALVLLFVVYPQLQVVLTPGPGGYVRPPHPGLRGGLS